MNFSDIFKSSFLENVTSVSLLDMVIALALSFGIGLFIFFVYKKTYSGVMYSASFGTTLIALTMITSITILAVTSNVVLSLGMVGALSIVRFRTAIKEPMEIVFLFWSLTAGIVIGAGLIPMAVFGSVIIGVMLLLFANRKIHLNPYILVLKCDGKDAEAKAAELLSRSVERFVVKTKTVSDDGTEITAELRLKKDDTCFVDELYALEGVRNAVLVSYNGEYMS